MSCSTCRCVTCPHLSRLPRPAGSCPGEQGPRANRFLITAYRASFCFGLGNGQLPKTHQVSYQPAVNRPLELILAPPMDLTVMGEAAVTTSSHMLLPSHSVPTRPPHPFRWPEARPPYQGLTHSACLHHRPRGLPEAVLQPPPAFHIPSAATEKFPHRSLIGFSYITL